LKGSVLRHVFNSGERAEGLRIRRNRQAKHDELCRPIFEGAVEGNGRGSVRVVLARLRTAKIPAPRGGEWHRRAVYRIAVRLGVNLLTGRAFGEFPRCPKCNKQTGRFYSDKYCRSCADMEWKRESHESLRRAELAEARERLRHFQDKVQALESGGRQYPRAYRKPKRRFGRDIKPREA